MKPTLLQLAIMRNGTLFIWPLTLPSAEGGGGRSWHESALKAKEIAKTKWIRIVADKAMGGYQASRRKASSMSRWQNGRTDKTFNELLEIAFADKIIMSEDHPVVRKLRGLRDDLLDRSPFREIWACDFEYRAPPGERPRPICMCARELRSGREIRLWENELRQLSAAPFDIGPDSVMLAYAAAAELSCFLELGWPLPVNVIDLFAEHRVATNGIPLPCGNGLLGALAIRGLAHIDAGEKEEMRRLILSKTDYSEEERAAILAYCMSDSDALEALLPTIADRPALRVAPRPLRRRGRPHGASGDPDRRRALSPRGRELGGAEKDLIAEVDAVFGVYDDGHFRLSPVRKVADGSPRRELAAHRDRASWRSTTTRSTSRSPCTPNCQSFACCVNCARP